MPKTNPLVDRKGVRARLCTEGSPQAGEDAATIIAVEADRKGVRARLCTEGSPQAGEDAASIIASGASGNSEELLEARH